MAKRNSDIAPQDDVTSTSSASGATTANALERRVLAFAEQLGRIAGIFQARAEGWMDREALARQIASVRDGAAELLEHLASGPIEASGSVPAAAAARGNPKGRSGGMVDAPGKKHRKPLPANPGVNKAASQAAKMRAAKTMVKTNRLRGRG